MLHFANGAYKRFVEQLRFKIEDIEDNINNLEISLKNITLYKNDLLEMLNYNEISYPEFVNVILMLINDFNLSPIIYNQIALVYSNNSEEQFGIKLKSIISKLIEEVDKKINEILISIKDLSKKNIAYISCLNSLNGLLAKDTPLMPIDDKKKLGDIKSIVNESSYTAAEKNIFWMQFNKLNLLALLERDKRLEKSNIEILKRKQKKLIINKGKINLQTEKEDFNDKELGIISIAKELVSTNEELLKDLSDDVISGVELIPDTNDFDYNLDENLLINEKIVLVHIRNLLRELENSKDKNIILKLDNAIMHFLEYQKQVNDTVKVEERLILELENENSEALKLIISAMEEYQKMLKQLKEAEFEQIKCIDAFKQANDFDNSLETFIKNINFKKGEAYYQKFKILVDLHALYSDYCKETNYEEKKGLLELMLADLDIYSRMKMLEEIINIPKVEENNQTAVNNVVLFLTFENGEISAAKYIEKQRNRFTPDDFNQLFVAIDKFENEERLHLVTRKVKGSPYGDKSRRYRRNNIRIVYIKLNNIGDLGINLTRDYYVIYSAGVKNDDVDLYDYSNSDKVQNELVLFFNKIKEEVNNICSLKISSEEKVRLVNEYLEKLSVDSLDGFKTKINTMRDPHNILDGSTGGRNSGNTEG